MRFKLHHVYDEFLKNKDKLQDEEYLYKFLFPHTVFKHIGKRGSRLRILQLPREFAQLLIFMSTRKIDRYLEIGTAVGGSWLTIDSYLRVINPTYQGSVGIDIKFRIRSWTEHIARFKNIEFRCGNSRDINLGQETFDLCYIDADHTEESVRNDFEKVKNNCRYVAFHDIVLQDSTVNAYWEEIKHQYEYVEFIDRSLPQTCGVGILKIKD
jgi:cephalosporin hydroxylase